MTRPDLSFSVNKLSQFLKAPTQLQWQACKRILRYIKGTLDSGMLFQPVTRFRVEAYVDVGWVGNIGDRRSTSGFCVYF